MRLRASGHRPGRVGAATVEFALLLPFIMFLFVVAIDFARIFYFGVVIENSARNGAYYASDYPNANYIYNDIYGYKNLDEAVLKDATGINGMTDSNKATYTVGYSSSASGPFTSTADASSKYVKVNVKWDFYSLTQFPGIPAVLNMNRGVIMKVAPALPDF